MLLKEHLHFWIDANLPPVMAIWLKEEYGVHATSFLELGFEKSSDAEVFKHALNNPSVIIITTKDIDFVNMSQSRQTKMPKILYMNIGNVTNTLLKVILHEGFTVALSRFLYTDTNIVEITK